MDVQYVDESGKDLTDVRKNVLRPDGETQMNIPQIMEEIGEVVRLILQERDQQCTVERIVHVTVSHIQEQVV